MLWSVGDAPKTRYFLTSLGCYLFIHPDDALRRSASADELGQVPSDDDDGFPQRKVKGMRGYVRPRPGTAEDAVVKRAQRKDATGMVVKVRKSPAKIGDMKHRHHIPCT